MKKVKSLTLTLKSMTKMNNKISDKEIREEETKKFQLKMLRIQQGIFHSKERVAIIFEGFDSAGKGGAIRTITEVLDPRSIKVVPIGAPTVEEKAQHYLYRFWNHLPLPGHITIYDRSWYGRVLVAKVDGLTSKKRIKEAYQEINQFEQMLVNDGIVLIKFFIAITKDEQLNRFNARLKDPYKQWKLTEDDIRARKNWNKYVKAVDEIFKKNNPPSCPWEIIEGNSKSLARYKVLSLMTSRLEQSEKWIEQQTVIHRKNKLEKMLQQT